MNDIWDVDSMKKSYQYVNDNINNITDIYSDHYINFIIRKEKFKFNIRITKLKEKIKDFKYNKSFEEKKQELDKITQEYAFIEKKLKKIIIIIQNFYIVLNQDMMMIIIKKE